MPITNLPSLSADAPWTGAPPDPLDEPALYDGLLWRRPIAYLLDLVLIALAAFAVWALLGLLSILSFGLLLPLQVVVLTLLPLAYHTWFIGSRGATPGMRLLDVELRSWTGARPDYTRAALQTALFYVTVALTTWLVLIVALFNDRRRTVHDYLGGTVGVRHSRIGAAALPAAA
jgi:uncharacterized RDD family membrane protein YckC